MSEICDGWILSEEKLPTQIDYEYDVIEITVPRTRSDEILDKICRVLEETPISKIACGMCAGKLFVYEEPDEICMSCATHAGLIRMCDRR